ncbi:beta-CASP ribonuclease aCPSF1 [Candidatus Woesearchaeota archaeon]|jgi:hypothetical protein|nr:beta-CASP ribonuclease aCPSF1 [Candidatus Woesearchaeota archaeon]MBT4835118.1 beta-CASP ribonuclease aCPSF1 [Candidatus Woesearchaeota archaeon]MBT6735053.1 beta-CASP ribonuclease aCPSF1 [Candidatus Woesearchaeota archaeon]MBT7170080.1 beta-CASP ribonuclease aCPSF1 [Candidatus Woesearchaeota archaeon]MBT7474825.1 beta-CASP ribonuclease aCPSF1 [Candidatus Woesearchaeota archaeon]
MAKIIEQVKDMLPRDADVTNISFEGANIVMYSKNKEFFLDNRGAIKKIVSTIKKRVELRCDPSIPIAIEKAEKEIRKIIPKEAGKLNVIFDPQRSQVIIEAEKPGIAIGKSGENLKIIKSKVYWVPLVKRIPSIRSKLIEKIRNVLYENDDYRKKFLHKIGERIYGPKRKEGKTNYARVTFLGASRQVGRSAFLLQTDESKILLDCGVNVAAKGQDQYPYMDVSELKIEELDAVVLSHAHLDHCGLIPLLFKYGYRGPVYCTAPTRDVAALLCLDMITIGNKENRGALYSSSDVKEMVKHTVILNYEEVSDISPDIRLTFYNAGHTLGSSMCHFHIGEGLHNFMYTGDMNFETSNLLAPAVTRFPRLETLMIEGTYGGKDDVTATRQESEDYLLNIIRTTIGRGGKVLLPVLGVGRSQEIMVIVERAIREGKLPQIPVFVQGMVWDVTAIHTAYPDFFNNKVKQAIFHKNENPFLSKIFKHVGSQKEMKQVMEETGPCIVMATSGMMTGGASVEYFKNLGENPKNSLVLTSYQGEGSLGRRLQHGEKEIMFMEGSKQMPVKVKMDIYSIHGFTGHSDRNQLMNFVGRATPRPKKLIVVHGEIGKVLDFASSAHKAYRMETTAPKNLETIRLV